MTCAVISNPKIRQGTKSWDPVSTTGAERKITECMQAKMSGKENGLKPAQNLDPTHAPVCLPTSAAANELLHATATTTIIFSFCLTGLFSRNYSSLFVCLLEV